MLKFLNVLILCSIVVLLLMAFVTIKNVNTTYSELTRILREVDATEVKVEVHTNNSIFDFNKFDFIEED